LIWLIDDPCRIWYGFLVFVIADFLPAHANKLIFSFSAISLVSKKNWSFHFFKKNLSTARRIYTRIDYNETSASLFLVRNVKQFLNVVIFSVIIIWICLG
jgi:hypothetical protein